MSQTQNSKKCFKEIYKFYYDYFKVYKLASSNRVGCWKPTDLKNALSWANACEELTGKLAEKVQFYEILLGEIHAILAYLQIDFPKAQTKKLVEDASNEMKKAIFDSGSLSDELRTDLVVILHAELYESSKEVQNSLDDSFTANAFKASSKMLDAELDDFKKQPSNPLQMKLAKFCELLRETGRNAELFDMFCVAHLKKTDDLALLKELIERLKRSFGDIYGACLIRLLDKKLLKLLKNVQSIEIFRFDSADTAAVLLKAYFCYLVDFYKEMEQDELESRPATTADADEQIDEASPEDSNEDFFGEANMSDEREPDDQFFADLESQEPSSKFIIEHFRNALSQDKDAEFSEILRQQERACNSLFNKWTFLLDRLG